MDSQQIRLVNGMTRCSGRVEVLHEGQWGSVCDDAWGLQEAEVVCRQMKCGTALGVKYQAHFGPGAGPILLDDLGCNGQERTLGECKHAGFRVNNCGHSEDAGVECSGIHFYSQFISKSSRSSMLTHWKRVQVIHLFFTKRVNVGKVPSDADIQ